MQYTVRWPREGSPASAYCHKEPRAEVLLIAHAMCIYKCYDANLSTRGVGTLNARDSSYCLRAVKQRIANKFSSPFAQGQRSNNHVCILINARITLLKWPWSHYNNIYVL